MRRFYILGFFFLMMFDTLGQISFKLSATAALPLEASLGWLYRIFSHPFVYFAILGYVGAFFTWMTLLRRAPVGPAFAASHLEVVTVMIASVLIFGETISLAHFAGALFIVAGIVCLAFAERDVIQKENEKS
ncbi:MULTISPECIES: multidrug efflux SMR transporter [Bartonella]|uniref:DMT family transporter n=1 Tax=Bartonella TaxID=773 RepID=UPI0018DECCB5|nr:MULTISPECIES: EamA family transporter [Bartonella]MBH9995088.1 EamA family transporter [Bartonella sp. P0291]MBH9996567.1 EamA family transporter [Bartonella sp. M0192]MBH9998727.1 EamA family transporter [Bartonella sp. M0191]MBI0008626.1 EamA family transporter [Bartonella sp. M0193]MBI0010018.1 EamA family transporter [Bartonella sp. M0176]